MNFLGLDTSNYTTSVAVLRNHEGVQAGKLLTVKQGELGLRQSDALFQHIKQLPALFSHLKGEGLLTDIAAVGASTRPRAVEGSYMPCFLAGESHGKALAATLGVPFVSVSHQQGHLAAAAWSAGRMDLLEQPFLAWHLSGGTTELLYVRPDGWNLDAKEIGGTNDISAGQLIDRTGVALGLQFPAGRALDQLAGEGEGKAFPVKLNGLYFSLSGMENQVKTRMERGEAPDSTARFTLDTICGVVLRATLAAREEYGALPVLFSGGVSCNSRLRRMMEPLGGIFADPVYSADNALGVAVLTGRAVGQRKYIAALFCDV